MAEQPSPELADVLAYLGRRRDNAALMAKASPEFADWAEDRRRQLEVVIDELENGLHHGCAQLVADIESLASACGGGPRLH